MCLRISRIGRRSSSYSSTISSACRRITAATSPRPGRTRRSDPWNAAARSANSHGRPWQPRPTTTPSQPVLAMVARTGCDGVVVGRGCQGRPWLFADLAAAFHGSDLRVRPGLGEVAAVIRRHAELMVDEYDDERRPMREMRKHMAWYLKGYVVGGALRAQLGLVETLAHLDELLGRLDLDQPYPGEAAEGQRG